MARISSHEAAWVAELLILLPQVEILSTSVHAGSMKVGEDRVPMVDLDVLVPTVAEAAALASELGLSKVGPGEPPTFWHEWSGWVHEGSREAACRVRVTAAHPVPPVGGPARLRSEPRHEVAA
ncbi:hypothetical protein ACIA03_28060 [Nocardioides sp. NPDC051685]|uniref:hypothetical protein n=1 Tax=Nocardioides sp. NPDC051685 TaxID=3364334 RepID=UPI00378E334C